MLGEFRPITSVVRLKVRNTPKSKRGGEEGLGDARRRVYVVKST
jgi:hypothetical protein